MSTVVSSRILSVDGTGSKEKSVVTELGLGTPRATKRYFWQRGNKSHDPDGIATLPSVFDDPYLAPKYQPPPNWENIHRFNPSARWTWREEDKLVGKIDWRITLWTCIMFIGLEIDRANIHQALTDDLLGDLGMTTNDYNFGNTLSSLAFLCAELPSQLISKWAGPDRWIPAQLCLWSLVATCQFWLSGRTSFLICRCLIGLLQGGFIPDIVLYLSYFFKQSEMSIRLGFFWLAMTLADIICAFLAVGVLQMRGVLGYAGWRWLFLIEGAFTLCVGILSFGMMPAGPTQTASWFRGKDGWFSPRDEEIMVNRVIRDDPSKSSMHNRERITLQLLWRSLCDYHLWPFYIMGFTNFLPILPLKQYLTLSLRSIGFDTLHTNLLVVPSQILSAITMLTISWFAEKTNKLLLVCLIPQVWAIPFLVWLRTSYGLQSDPWTVWAIMTILCAAPFTHPILVSLVSRNANAVRARTVSAALYNMCVQAGGMIGANVYRTHDAPLYRVGNTALLAVLAYNFILFSATILYYRGANRHRQKAWDAMSDDEKADYLSRNSDTGNKRLDFRFSY